jgi:hypothetical protein
MSSTVPLLQHPPEIAQGKHEHMLQLVVRPPDCTLMLNTLCSLQAAARSIIAVQLQLQCGPYANCLGPSQHVVATHRPHCSAVCHSPGLLGGCS